MSRVKGEMAAMKYLSSKCKNMRLVREDFTFRLEELSFHPYYDCRFWFKVWEVKLRSESGK